jgi:hypothetical protein
MSPGAALPKTNQKRFPPPQGRAINSRRHPQHLPWCPLTLVPCLSPCAQRQIFLQYFQLKSALFAAKIDVPLRHSTVIRALPRGSYNTTSTDCVHGKMLAPRRLQYCVISMATQCPEHKTCIFKTNTGLVEVSLLSLTLLIHSNMLHYYRFYLHHGQYSRWRQPCVSHDQTAYPHHLRKKNRIVNLK